MIANANAAHFKDAREPDCSDLQNEHVIFPPDGDRRTYLKS